MSSAEHIHVVRYYQRHREGLGPEPKESHMTMIGIFLLGLAAGSALVGIAAAFDH